MTKQELINKVKKMDDKDFLSQPLVLEILEQLDEPPIEECGVCEHLSALVNENGHQAGQIEVLKRALSNVINANESFENEVDCEGEQCNACFTCVYHSYIREADEELKDEEFEMT